MTRGRNIGIAVFALAVACSVLTYSSSPAKADTLICETYGSVAIQNGQYIVQNNVWGASTAQCINVTDTGFQVTVADHNNSTSGAPAAYPSIYKGCHYANCTSGSPFPASINSLGAINSSVSINTPSSGEWNAAYDVWYDPTPRTDGQNTGAELMIWINHLGRPQPVGSKVGTASIAGATWDVWYGNTGWNVISYVRQQTTNSFTGNLADFHNDAISRGYIQQSWYVTSVQYGFEPWIGGVGLGVNSFSVSTGGTTTTTTRPTTTTTRVTTTTTTRPTTTTTTRPTTTTTGGSGLSCSVTRLDQWGSGYVAYVRVTNNGAPVSGWSVPLTFNQSTTVTNAWNANLSGSGSSWTASNNSWNGNLGTGSSVDFGFQGTASGTVTLSCGGSQPTTTTTRPTTTTTTTRPTTTTTTTRPTTTTTRVTTTTTTRPTTTTTGSGGVSCSVRLDQWGSGYVAYVTVTNGGSSAVSSWSTRVGLNQSTTVTNAWNANVSVSGSTVTGSNLSWNGYLGVGQSVTYGFQGTASGNVTATCS